MCIHTGDEHIDQTLICESNFCPPIVTLFTLHDKEVPDAASLKILRNRNGRQKIINANPACARKRPSAVVMSFCTHEWTWQHDGRFAKHFKSISSTTWISSFLLWSLIQLDQACMLLKRLCFIGCCLMTIQMVLDRIKQQLNHRRRQRSACM
jgi:hypothetical protein